MLLTNEPKNLKGSYGDTLPNSYPSNFVWSSFSSIFSSAQDISTKIPPGLGLSSSVISGLAFTGVLECNSSRKCRKSQVKAVFSSEMTISGRIQASIGCGLGVCPDRAAAPGAWEGTSPQAYGGNPGKCLIFEKIALNKGKNR